MKFTLDNLFVKARGASSSIDQELAPHICRAVHISDDALKSYRIIRRSIDARQKPDVKLLYKIEAEISDDAVPENCLPTAENQSDWRPCTDGRLKGHHVIVVGAGPAGLFGALTIAMAGGVPLVVDRGQDVHRRRDDIDRFIATRQLDTESNYLFGEGGAGTWSDGKLFTRVNDARIAFVLDQFIQCGALPQIAYFAHPHIGSDALPKIIENLRKEIIALGGEFRWGAKMESAIVKDGRCTGIRLASGEVLQGDAVIIACGHSSRELLLNFTQQGIGWQPKGFQIGMRIEHPQGYVNQIQYGMPLSFPALGAAEYNIVSKPSTDGTISGVTSFCMCPGGKIIPATSDRNQFCSNGMSNAKRDGKFANSALIATLLPADWGHGDGDSLKAAYDFIAQLESEAFLAGGGDYSAPAQNASDFLNGKLGKIPSETSYELGLRPARLDKILPQKISDALRHALRHFDKMHPGFCANGTFIGIETRVSSPARFLRNPQTLESTVRNLYFAGEGAGMAGGITSAAVDGIKMAEAIISSPC